MADTQIEYCDKVLEVTGGCTKCSPGCQNCWAIKEIWRMTHNPLLGNKWQGLVEKKNGVLNWTGKIKCFEDALNVPLRRKKPTRYFIDSKADLFHEKVPFEFIDKVHAMMIMAGLHGCYHTYLILTKRIKRTLKYYSSNRRTQLFEILEKDYKQFTGFFGINWPFPKTLHLGVSISNQAEMWKATELSKIHVAVRWISFEPLLSKIDLALDYGIKDDCTGEREPKYIDGVVVGGESGPGARPMNPGWARSIRDQCETEGVPFYMKQMGGHPNKRAKLEDIPEDLRIRDLIDSARRRLAVY